MRSLKLQAPPNQEDLPTTAQQLDKIKAHLELLLLALKTLVSLDSEAMVTAAKELKINVSIAHRVKPSDLLIWSKNGDNKNKQEVEEAQNLVLIVSHLAKEHQELIRRGVSLLEQIIEQNQKPQETELLGNYLKNFAHTYLQEREKSEHLPKEKLEELALKLLVDLLFYSASNGQNRLWLALLNYAGEKD